MLRQDSEKYCSDMIGFGEELMRLGKELKSVDGKRK